MRKYKHLDTLPIGRASDEITEGCLVLEGGAWRGLYTVGVLDAMMENDINLRTTVGISAGGLSGVGYVSGANVPDKLEKCGFTVTKSDKVNAPVIDQLPVAIECKVIDLQEEYNETRIVADIVGM